MHIYAQICKYNHRVQFIFVFMYVNGSGGDHFASDDQSGSSSLGSLLILSLLTAAVSSL